MQEDRVARIYRQMLEDLEKLGQKGITDFQEAMSGWTQDLLKDAFDPRKFMHFIRSMGINMSQLPGMVGQQPGFDPYRVLGLEKSASDEEVKNRYRKLIHKLHPDTAGVEGTSFLLQMVLAAYELIKTERGWQ